MLDFFHSWLRILFEEYTAETAAFIKGIETGEIDARNSFETALATDHIIKLMEADAEKGLK